MTGGGAPPPPCRGAFRPGGGAGCGPAPAGGALGDEASRRLPGDEIGPMMILGVVGRLAGADRLDADDVVAFGGEEDRGNECLRQLLGRDDHRSGARIAEDMGVIAGRIGDVGRDRDAAGGADDSGVL